MKKQRTMICQNVESWSPAVDGVVAVDEGRIGGAYRIICETLWTGMGRFFWYKGDSFIV